MDRPTKTLTTRGGLTVVLKEWITINEQREITKAYSEAKIKSINAKDQTAEFADGGVDIMAAMELMQRTSIELVVVALDGSSERLADRILGEMPQSDALEIIEAVGKITHPTPDAEGPKKN